jgi:hypothetical protein
MEAESEKYTKVLNLLRNSKPELDSTEDIEIEVIKMIKKTDRPGFILPDAIDFLFSWVYIGWVRRTLITASVALVLVFVFQQGVILKRIEILSKQTIVPVKENVATPSDEIEKLLVTYKISVRRFPSKTIAISEREMKELLESVKELQIKYKDLEDIIQGDPELKQLIEKKLIENNRTKINL